MSWLGLSHWFDLVFWVGWTECFLSGFECFWSGLVRFWVVLVGFVLVLSGFVWF